MADYRELLRKAIDALPDNTGANRRAVYEKARSALVAQLRAIDPPLPAREITTHRLNLEDCIREVEHEATERLLGRFRAVEETEPEVEPEIEAIDEEPVAAFDDADEAPAEPEPELEPEGEPEAVESDNFGSSPAEDFIAEPEPAEPRIDEPEPAEPYLPEEAAEADALEEDRLSLEQKPVFEPVDDAAPIEESGAGEIVPEVEPENEPASFRPGSIEDIIASAERASLDADQMEPTADGPDAQGVIAPFAPATEPEEHEAPRADEKHFIISEADAQPRSSAPLVDLHGRPLSGTHEPVSKAEPAMSSVREVDLEPGILARPEVSDAQVAIDRAIAALDREARGEATATDDAHEPIAAEDDQESADAENGDSRGGFGAFTIFLLISILLLGGGGLGGYWAWREGFIDLNALFAQNQTPETTEVADAEVPEEPASTDAQTEVPAAVNTTPEVPSAGGEVSGSPMPGEELPFTETETPSTAPSEPEATFEDRLPAEAGTPVSPDGDSESEPGVEITTDGPQSLLLEEQTGGAAGAVPYTGSVEWSRGTDELGHPTIIAEASIPARNLDVDVLLRRNADANLPASHLMEVDFTVAESFVGGSIANLPGVLLKNEELVQGQPLTGASARIVGNSFLFALSSASDIDVENNLNLLENREWVDLAMVYGTGRRAILTLEKGEDGDAIFADVMAAWAELDAEASADAEPEAEEAPAEAAGN
ncbi:hypothetical protein [Pelagibacterium halotolerans]|uniref:CheA signal transduction histidine kinase n=1 Tax=Pelagibacterium halotolerans (strain DSM 22347 / JCM 15775 / CGMCC 1.7692 / B2) TaxID=1082931 RepID=G4R957_PELHB|nr:hypothetical protein [Pelagibacterium halotolerans]AEQ52437.1 hypothetical protein KKY_2429 [Pelagibacterium halotolerans B2]QJR17832.1 hypothetical protein HKM20_04905 [Pelagibacterium halotolerans]SEA36395.1 hypothetical protein SAMN05428936_103177 [Pelagibacterium halotolerans]